MTPSDHLKNTAKWAGLGAVSGAVNGTLSGIIGASILNFSNSKTVSLIKITSLGSSIFQGVFTGICRTPLETTNWENRKVFFIGQSVLVGFGALIGDTLLDTDLSFEEYMGASLVGGVLCAAGFFAASKCFPQQNRLEQDPSNV